MHFDENFRPIACTRQRHDELPARRRRTPIGQSSTRELLGIVDKTSVVVTRTGSNLTANPLGTPVHSFVTDQTYSLLFQRFLEDQAEPHVELRLELYACKCRLTS